MKELEKIHQQGYALFDQQPEEGIISIAVPVLSRSKQVIAAANVAGHTSHTSVEKMLSAALPALGEAVKGIQCAYREQIPGRICFSKPDLKGRIRAVE